MDRLRRAAAPVGAARVWPQQARSRSQLLLDLIHEGHRAISDQAEAQREARRLVAPTAVGAADQFIAIARRLGIAEIGLPAASAAPLAELRAQTGLKLPDCCVLPAATQMEAAAVAARDERLRTRAGELGFATP